MLNPLIGLYAARIIAKSNPKKDLVVVGPADIIIDKDTHQFEINLKGPLENVFYNEQDPRLLEIYMRTA